MWRHRRQNGLRLESDEETEWDIMELVLCSTELGDTGVHIQN